MSLSATVRYFPPAGTAIGEALHSGATVELFCPWASDGQPKALRLEEPRKLIVSPLCWTKQKGYAEKQALLQDEAMLHCGQRRRALAALVWGGGGESSRPTCEPAF